MAYGDSKTCPLNNHEKCSDSCGMAKTFGSKGHICSVLLLSNKVSSITDSLHAILVESGLLEKLKYKYDAIGGSSIFGVNQKSSKNTAGNSGDPGLTEEKPPF